MNKSSLFENEYDELCKKVIHGYNLLFDMGVQYLSSSIKQKSKVLSIGCGTANEIFAMKKYKNQYNFIGFDISPEMIDIANNKISSSNIKNVYLKESDISGIKENDFDAAFLSLVLARINGNDKKKEFISDIASKLNNNSKIIYIDYFIDEMYSELQERIWANNAKNNGVSQEFIDNAIAFGKNELHFNTVTEAISNFNKAGFVDPILCGSANMYRCYMLTKKG